MKHPRPFHQEVELRAYELWQERGRPWATPETDWFRAELEMTGAQPEGGLTRVAREVGTAIGTVVALVTAAEPPGGGPTILEPGGTEVSTAAGGPAVIASRSRPFAGATSKRC